MTDKTDALVAKCRAHVHACEAMRMPATAQLLREVAEALAEQPAASVDVGCSPADSIALTTIIGVAAEMDNFADVADRCQLTEGNAPAAIRAWRERLLALIDSAGGAKVYQCPRCSTSMEVDPTARPNTEAKPNREAGSA